MNNLDRSFDCFNNFDGFGSLCEEGTQQNFNDSSSNFIVSSLEDELSYIVNYAIIIDLVKKTGSQAYLLKKISDKMNVAIPNIPSLPFADLLKYGDCRDQHIEIVGWIRSMKENSMF